mgnify:CR=1 FL=1
MKILFQGDSVTDAGRDRSNPHDMGEGYPRYASAMIQDSYPDTGFEFVNLGISGNRTADLVSRLESDFVDVQPDIVSVMIGINDVWRQFDSPAIPDEQVSPEEYRSNVEKMILSVKDNVKGIFLMTPYYMEPNGEDWMRKRMDTYGAICSELAEKYGCRFIDLQAVFNDYFQYRHSSYIAWDRIHPNQIGATVIARAFLEKCGFDYNHRPEHA